MTSTEHALEAGVSATDALRLASAVVEIAEARDLAELARLTCESLRGLLHADGATFVLKEGDQVYYAEEDACDRLWKGRRFPAESCISGWVIDHNTSVAIEDIYSDPRIPVDAYRPTFVHSLAAVPVNTNQPVGALGIYWSDHHKATARELCLADVVASAVAALFERVQQKVADGNQSPHAERMLAVVVHDLKSPLSAIANMAQALQLRDSLRNVAADELARIESSAATANRLVEQLNVFSRVMGSGVALSLGMVQLDQLCAKVIEEIRATVPECVVEWSAEPVTGLWDADRLSEAFANLVRNASQHGDAERPVLVRVDGTSDEALIEVQNHGEPIAPELLARVYEPFSNFDPGSGGASMGLGLYIVDQIVSAHGGRIEVQSSAEHGTVFRVRLPRGAAMLPN